ncbi:MAG: hypothetical protein H7276_07500 [Caulobacter sp.]|nr:hypothetical protein [Vitreoscilla sp.]
MNKHMMAAALAVAAAIAAPAHATTVALPADGSWHEFNVDAAAPPANGTGWIDYADGSPLSFQFTIAAGTTGTLSVVDAGFAGDTFTINNFGATLGRTSSVAIGNVEGNVEFDFDAAFGNAAYSHGVFTLGAGTYDISGSLLQSVQDDIAGTDLDATNGALRLSVSSVPGPSGIALSLGGLAAVALVARRRRPNPSI